MSDDDIPEPEPTSMPGWVMTFADLMSLLMCFFVLLLSFSEMDLQKFKQVAGSMEKAFGVQREVKVSAIPRGTSIIAQEFSPGRPEPTPLNEVRQSTANELEDMLKIETTKVDSSDGAAQSIAEEKIEDIRGGLLEMEIKDQQIVIRILEKGSFPSGSATLRAQFLPVLKKIGDVLATTPGMVTVAGYTDNIPIQTDVFRSNWELSATRAFSVIDELLKNEELKANRFILQGHGENQPIAPNDTIENRAKNRRVELVIRQGEELEEFEEGEVIKIEDDADTNQLPGIEKLDEVVEPTFPPVEEVTSDGSEDYLSEGGDLGVFEEDALYDYELGDEVIGPVLDGDDLGETPDGETPETETSNVTVEE